ncbi:hypothetical protein KPSA1B_104683 [Pseudomonas syringae pv. actinidiae]|nr:hypothetical protein KPSA1B_104683 [Pseudomonas syringae pv. actinidiae]
MGGRIIVESVAGCSWNGWPDDRGIRSYMCRSVAQTIKMNTLAVERPITARLEQRLAQRQLWFDDLATGHQRFGQLARYLS